MHALNDGIAKHNARNPDKTILLLDFNALDPALTESKCSFWHFRFEPNSDMLLSALMSFMAEQRAIQKVYLINQDYAYGQGVSRGLLERCWPESPSPDLGRLVIAVGRPADLTLFTECGVMPVSGHWHMRHRVDQFLESRAREVGVSINTVRRYVRQPIAPGHQVRPRARRLTDRWRAEARALYVGPAARNAVVVQRLLAERGLADPFSDPTTAVMVIDRLHDCLRQLALRVFPSGRHCDAAGDVRFAIETMADGCAVWERAASNGAWILAA